MAFMKLSAVKNIETPLQCEHTYPMPSEFKFYTLTLAAQ